MDIKWQRLSSETIIKDRWIDLRADECRTPNGQEISPYYVLNYPDWVHVVAITQSDELVLVRQYRHGAQDVFLELPAGTVDANDSSPEVSARRELEEETGYQAAELLLISSLFPNPAIQSNRVHTYLAIGVQPTGTRKLDAGEEGMTVHLLPVREALANLQGGILPQSLHVASLMLALSVSGHLSLPASLDAPK
ncbi:NUDIX hydrolase [Bosea sp. SSUT16]|jgi:8-oxo-dGTP pyrophosphatase MutT (NUDIX family)|uniref:NUDIX hydrolase n=1 Tax=Bosea spartocytisi TaxID=2773451 RepID=A0A927E5U8_9HYPH|nr:NUDIX hydrolase [Bosea spartocytisi]MBD3844884.1 NUDIX hydrolase [Bosea spartocytisi]MCT4471086.1 NUDIX hydrolase [Bosea spartocytisi]